MVCYSALYLPSLLLERERDSKLHFYLLISQFIGVVNICRLRGHAIISVVFTSRCFDPTGQHNPLTDASRPLIVSHAHVMASTIQHVLHQLYTTKLPSLLSYLTDDLPILVFLYASKTSRVKFRIWWPPSSSRRWFTLLLPMHMMGHLSC